MTEANEAVPPAGVTVLRFPVELARALEKQPGDATSVVVKALAVLLDEPFNLGAIVAGRVCADSNAMVLTGQTKRVKKSFRLPLAMVEAVGAYAVLANAALATRGSDVRVTKADIFLAAVTAALSGPPAQVVEQHHSALLSAISNDGSST